MLLANSSGEVVRSFPSKREITMTVVDKYKLILESQLHEYTTSVKKPRFGHLSKFLPIVHMKISSPDSNSAP